MLIIQYIVMYWINKIYIYFFKEQLYIKAISITYVPSSKQVVDTSTEGVASLIFQHLIYQLGIDDIHTLTWGRVLNEIF